MLLLFVFDDALLIELLLLLLLVFVTARARIFIGDVCGGGDVARGALSFGCAYGDVYVKNRRCF